MNVTLTLDDELVARAREIASRQGTTLDDLVRRYLEVVAGRRKGTVLADEMQRLWNEAPGHSGGRRIAREEAYDDRL